MFRMDAMFFSYLLTRSGWVHTVLRIRDVYPGSEFFHPKTTKSRVKKNPDPGSGTASKNLSILTQKLFLSSRKYNRGCSSRIRILFFLPIPDPGVTKAPDSGSRIRIRNTGFKGDRFTRFVSLRVCYRHGLWKENRLYFHVCKLPDPIVFKGIVLRDFCGWGWEE